MKNKLSVLLRIINPASLTCTDGYQIERETSFLCSCSTDLHQWSTLTFRHAGTVPTLKVIFIGWSLLTSLHFVVVSPLTLFCWCCSKYCSNSWLLLLSMFLEQNMNNHWCSFKFMVILPVKAEHSGKWIESQQCVWYSSTIINCCKSQVMLITAVTWNVVWGIKWKINW